jgi:hypothetical protein
MLVLSSVDGARGADLRETLRRGAVRRVNQGDIELRGSTSNPACERVRIRVCDSFGVVSEAAFAVNAGEFSAMYPSGFPGAPALRRSVLYIDATEGGSFAEDQPARDRGEISLLLTGADGAAPDLPLVFMDDFLDVAGGRDQTARQWERNRTLVNHFMRSGASARMGVGRRDFDLGRSADFQWFKDHATLFEFEHRDRDWTVPLGNRVACGFWQAVWNRWFNASNDHPWDGNAENREASNYRPYTFANDLADLLVLNRMLLSSGVEAGDRRRALGDEVLENLMAMQHQSAENFALEEASGRRERYTRGAFRYGLFETGEWMTEGKGWFVKPAHRDFARGGVFNGRSVWALGESLKAVPSGAQAERVKGAIGSALRFCLRDALELGYARRTASGAVLWSRLDGEHAYLWLGVLAAYEADPEMKVDLSPQETGVSLSKLACEGLNALAESVGADGLWSRYSNGAAVNVAALALGATRFPSHPEAPKWRAVAMAAADRWMGLSANEAGKGWKSPMFGHMTEAKDASKMTFVLSSGQPAHVSLYVGGHWIHALSLLYELTHESRYAERAGALVGYYLGDNPVGSRLLNEIGAVNNRVTDADGDGLEDTLHWDAYPESTAFMQIGLLHFLRACPGTLRP